MKDIINAISKINDINSQPCHIQVGYQLFSSIVNKYTTKKEKLDDTSINTYRTQDGKLLYSIFPYYVFMPQHFKYSGIYIGHFCFSNHYWGSIRNLY